MPRAELMVDRETVFEKLDYKPHSDGQWAAHHSESRFRTACCGRRWGKSQWAGHEMTLQMFKPDSINWICAPTYGLGEKEFRVVYSDFKKLGLLSRCRKSYNIKQGDMRIHFTDLNSLCLVVSADKPDSLVGEGLHHVIMSEAAKHKMSTWQMYIEPALADHRGSADFPSTPQGFNWFKGMYDLGKDNNQPEYDSWHFPTWHNTVMFPGGFDDPELQRIRQSRTNMFWDQEYAAKFTAYEGLVYQDFDPEKHVKHIPYIHNWENYMSLDFGFKDPTICLDIMVDPSTQRAYVWREYVVVQKIASEHAIALRNREQPPGYHVDEIFADPRGADEIATMQLVLGSIVANSMGRSIGIEAVAAALRIRDDGLPGLIIDPSCKNLIEEIQGYHAKPTVEGRNEKAGTFDTQGPDHSLDALRYFFNERFILGGSEGLADIYTGYNLTEAQTFFNYASNFSYGANDSWR